MSQQRRNDFLVPLLAVVSDIIAVEAAFLLSYWLRFDSPLTAIFEVTHGVPPLSGYLISSAIFIPIWLAVFQSRRMYGARRNTHMSDEFFSIVRLVSIGLLFVMSATFFYRGFSYSRGVFILLWATSILTIAAGRFLLMEFEKFLYRHGRELKTVAIVGSNETADVIYSIFLSHPSLGFEIVGYYADSPAPPERRLSHSKYLGRMSSLPGDIPRYRLQAALIALSYKEHPQLLEMIREAEGLNVELMMVPDMLDMMTSRIRIQEVEGIPFIKVKEIPLSTWNRITKRMFDVLVSMVVLIVALPLLALIALLIVLTSPGPIFFVQERIGLDGRAFNLYKFRTMRTDAEEETGPVRARKGDSRATVVGRILRRTSLDELPQLLNVLQGRMSIVGPRPERPFFVEQFKGKIPRYLERHRVKTGMTGWAQVNGLRGDTPIDQRTKYDIYYVENWSLVFDMKIILKTIRAVVFGKEAY